MVFLISALDFDFEFGSEVGEASFRDYRIEVLESLTSVYEWSVVDLAVRLGRDEEKMGRLDVGKEV